MAEHSLAAVSLSVPSAVEEPGVARRQMVIGIGNGLRSDDAIGPLLAEEVRSWRRQGVEALSVQQLTPELAQRLAACARVLFIDAWTDHGDDQGGVGAEDAAPLLEPLPPFVTSAPPAPFSHHHTPEALLQLAQQLYGHRPVAWWLRVPAHDLALGDQLSPASATLLAPARRALRHWLNFDA